MQTSGGDKNKGLPASQSLPPITAQDLNRFGKLRAFGPMADLWLQRVPCGVDLDVGPKKSACAAMAALNDMLTSLKGMLLYNDRWGVHF